MAALSWFFAQNEHGSDHGYHDAGIETFRENLLSSIARETIQNSLDARKSSSKPVDVRFDLVHLPVKNIPDVSSLDDAMKRSSKYWSHDPRASKFFKHASKLLSQPKVPALRVSDQNTTGLTGTDGDRSSNWYNLIRCFGASSKNAGEGGSFGIGSSAPFAASRLRTILYSTATGRNKYGFIGIARLATHKGTDKVKVNPDGYLGIDTGRMVDDPMAIPKSFRRTDTGTTLTILGFDGGEDWADELKLSIVENFWPAIYYGDLVVTVGKSKINSNNIEDLLL